MTSNETPALRTLTPEKLPRSFRFILATTAAEGFGDAMARTLMPLLAVTVLGYGTGFVGVINSIGLGAFLLLGMPIGMLIDRLRDRRRAMGAASLARFLALGILAATFFAGWLSGPVVVGVAVVIGMADVVFTTAQGPVIQGIVPKEGLKLAYSRMTITDQSAGTTASAIGSAMLGLWGLPGLLWLAISSYAVSFLLQRGIPPKVASSNLNRRERRKFSDGFRTLRRNPALWSLTISSALVNAGVMLGNTVLPVFLLRDLGIAPAFFAALGIVSAVGAILGAAVAPRLSAKLGLRILRTAAALLSMPAVAMAIACQQLPGHELIWLAAQSMSWSFLVAIASVAGAEVLPRAIPAETLASVGSAQRTITLGVMPVAALLGGVLAVFTGPVLLLWIWALLAGCAALPIICTAELDAYR
ncbi:MFS transporter [Glutamicibacter bergerei]|uniref:MFS transporter n=1 Tax=Glutamicibacter bergerei TaxID=256702 RepID=A0ABV9MRA7_9MICC